MTDSTSATAATVWQSCDLCAEIRADWPGFSDNGLRRLHVQHGHAQEATDGT